MTFRVCSTYIATNSITISQMALEMTYTTFHFYKAIELSRIFLIRYGIHLMRTWPISDLQIWSKNHNNENELDILEMHRWKNSRARQITVNGRQNEIVGMIWHELHEIYWPCNLEWNRKKKRKLIAMMLKLLTFGFNIRIIALVGMYSCVSMSYYYYYIADVCSSIIMKMNVYFPLKIWMCSVDKAHYTLNENVVPQFLEFY